jgi:hypothetical protein
MKNFIITETRLVEATWTYEIKAETESEALKQILEGNESHSHFKIADIGKEPYFDILEQE